MERSGSIRTKLAQISMSQAFSMAATLSLRLYLCTFA